MGSSSNNLIDKNFAKIIFNITFQSILIFISYFLSEDLILITAFFIILMYTKNKLNYILYFLFLVLSISINLIVFWKLLIFIFTVSIVELIQRNNYLKSDISNYLLYFSTLIYIVLKFETQAYILKANTDIQLFLINAYRLDLLNGSTFEINWDHKGPLISNLYMYIIKVNFFENPWYGIAFFYFFLIFLSIFLINRNLKNYFNNEHGFFIFLTCLLIVIDIVNQNTAAYSTFDTRFITTTLNIVAIYFFLNSKYKISVFIFFLNYLNLVSNILVFLLFHFFLFIFKSIDKKVIFNNFSIYSLLILCHTIWLLFTNQFESYYLNNIRYNAGLGGNYFDLNIIKIIFDNYFFIIPAALLIFKFFNRSEYKFLNYKTLVVFLFLSEFIHLIVTGPRFYQYNVLIIPALYILCLIFLVEIDLTKKKIGIYFILVSLLIPTFLSNYGIFPKNYSSERPLDYTFDTSNFYSNLSPLNHVSDPRINTLVEIKPEGNKKVGLVLANTKDYDFIFNELNIIPSTRVWNPIYHRKEFSESRFPIDKKLIYKNFMNDFNSENPTVYIMTKMNTEFKNSVLYDFFINELVLTYCVENFCYYEKK